MRVLDSSVPEEGEMFQKGGYAQLCLCYRELQKMRTAKLMVAQEVVSVLFFELSIDRYAMSSFELVGHIKVVMVLISYCKVVTIGHFKNVQLTLYVSQVP